MSDLSVSASSLSSFQRYGIPQREEQSPELALLERLVWVKYQSHWWPALLYSSYSELQTYLYDQLDMVLKAQFAMAIMKQLQEKQEIKVARLLGRQILEVVEVLEDNYCEFYWQLPNVLPKACEIDVYGGDVELYLDFHRALDQVEDIIRDVSKDAFALLPSSSSDTWLQRAKKSVNEARSRGALRQVQSNGSDDNNNEATLFDMFDDMMSTFVSSFDSAGQEKNLGVEVEVRPTKDANRINDSKNNHPMQGRRSPATQGRRSPAAQGRRSPAAHRNLSPDVPRNRSRQRSTPELHEIPEAREPTSGAVQNRRNNNSNRPRNNTSVKKPIHVLPGLEGDDIIPGLSAKVESMWQNVLCTMSSERTGMDEGDKHALEFREDVNGRRNNGMISTAPRRVEDDISFWNALTCHSLV